MELKWAYSWAHAGRKCESNDEFIVGPSPVAYSEDHRVPRQLDQVGIDKIVEQFKEAALRAYKAGFDMIELHGAHGYLINEFLSPCLIRELMSTVEVEKIESDS